MTPGGLPMVRRCLAALGLYVLAALSGAAVLTLALRLWEADPHVPLHYALGGDADFFLGLFQNTLETGWYTTSARLGAPGTMDLHDFPDVMTGTFLVVKLLGLFTRDLGLVFNSFYLLSFVLAIGTSLHVARRLGVCSPVAVGLSLIYALLPYHFYRGMNHPHYSLYYPVPLVVLVGLWVIGGEAIFLGRDEAGRVRWRWDRGRAVTALVAAALLAVAGTYYTVLGTALLAAASLIAVVRRPARWEHGVEAGVLAALVGALFLAQLAPIWAYRIEHGANPAAVERTTSDYYSFGLSLNNLLMPSAWHRVEAVRPLSLEYQRVAVAGPNSAFHGQNEAVGSNPLGLVGGVGLVGLMAVGVAAPLGLRRRLPRLGSLAALCLAALLFTLTGGVSELIALHVTPLLRSYNRMAIFLGFMALLAVGLVASALHASWAQTAPRRWLFGLLVAGVTALALWEQIPAAVVPDYAREAALFRGDRRFVQRVEAELPADARVFQLPLVAFPEDSTAGIAAFDHLRGFYHSRRLRWSFGAAKGRSVAGWQREVVVRPVPEFLEQLRAAEFHGLYVNRSGYPDRGARLIRELSTILGTPAVASTEGDLVFFSFKRIEGVSWPGREERFPEERSR